MGSTVRQTSTRIRLVALFAVVSVFATGLGGTQDTATPQSAAPAHEVPPPVLSTHLIGPLHLLLCNGSVGVVASIGEDGTLLVDTGYASTTAAVADELTRLGGGPVRFIVNSHHDNDHVGGNEGLGGGAVIMAHAAVRERVSRYFALPPLKVSGLPNLTTTDPATIHFNGDTIRIIPVPGAHTEGDLVVYFVESNVAYVGDLVLLGGFPNADPARGGDARRLLEVLRNLLGLLPDDATLVAAHGGAFAADQLREYIDMVEWTLATVRRIIDSSTSVTQITEGDVIDRWTDVAGGENGNTWEAWASEVSASVTGTARESICAPVTEVLVADGVDAAIDRYRRLATREADRWSFAENELNMLGYQLLAREKIEEAIAIFELNTQVFPASSNAFDSLGEAYMTAGDAERAIVNYPWWCADCCCDRPVGRVVAVGGISQ